MLASQTTVNSEFPVHTVTESPCDASGYTSPAWWYDLRGFGILTLSYRGSLGTQISFFEKNLMARHLEVF